MLVGLRLEEPLSHASLQVFPLRGSERAEQEVHGVSETNMEKHTISVGTDTLGETVRFTTRRLGTAAVNGGSDGGGMDITFYRLPDDTYRALIEREGISLLEPSNFVGVFGTDQPA